MTHYDFAVRLHGKIALQTAFAYAGWDMLCLQMTTFRCCWKNQNAAVSGAHTCKNGSRSLPGPRPGVSGACAKKIAAMLLFFYSLPAASYKNGHAAALSAAAFDLSAYRQRRRVRIKNSVKRYFLQNLLFGCVRLPPLPGFCRLGLGLPAELLRLDDLETGKFLPLLFFQGVSDELGGELKARNDDVL